MNQKKVLCNISNATMPLDIKDHKQNFDTYSGLLNYFDELHIVCRADFNKIVREGNIYIHHIKVPSSGILRYLFSIVKMFFKVIDINKEYNISVLNASEPTTGGMVCSLSSFFIKKPFLLEVQGEMTNIDPSTVGVLKSKVMRLLTLFSSKKSTHIRVVSDIIKHQLIEDGFKDGKITVVYPRIKLDDFDISKYKNTKEEICNKYNITTNKKIFLFVGRLVIFKGLKYLLEAIKEIKDDNILFLIAGDGELKNELEQQAKELTILDKVKFIGAIPYADVPYLMSGADYFIVPSVDEGFGRVVIEAMAMRLPVLASRVGGIKDIIKDEENGFFFESKNPEEIVKVVSKVLNISDNTLYEVIKNGYDKVYHNYEYSIGMKKYLNMYKKILNDN
jgi:glycosyltransferase involved in cell wall biosynthesis